MLRINLLPPYIYDKQKKLPFIIGSLLLIPITLVLMLLWGQSAQAALDKANERKTAAQAEQTKYNQFEAEIKKEKDTVAATKQKEDFVANSIKYNDSWPKIYTAMRDVTSPKILLKSMYVSDDRKSINFTGFCAYEEDLVRWWMYLRSHPMFTDVHFRLPDHPWPPKAEGTASNGGGGGAAGMPMGMSGPGGSSGPSGAAGAGNDFPGVRSGTMSGMPMGMGGSAGPGGGGSFGGPGGGGNADAVGDTVIEGRKGINFTAFAVLKDPLAGGIATPSWGAGGAGAQGGGAGGMMPSGSAGGMNVSMPR